MPQQIVGLQSTLDKHRHDDKIEEIISSISALIEAALESSTNQEINLTFTPKENLPRIKILSESSFPTHPSISSSLIEQEHETTRAIQISRIHLRRILEALRRKEVTSIELSIKFKNRRFNWVKISEQIRYTSN
jgi:hypothetical protein